MDALLETLLRRPDLPRLKVEIDHLLDDETRRRQQFYDDLVDGDRHEFVNGEMVMASPARFSHIRCLHHVNRIIADHVQRHDLGLVVVEQALVRTTRNDYQPDFCFWRKEVSDTFDADVTIFPPPDLVVEVLSDSTEHRDRGVKFDDYAAHGVREYWIVDPDNRSIEQYVNENDAFRLLRKLDDGLLPCEMIQGLQVPLSEVFAR